MGQFSKGNVSFYDTIYIFTKNTLHAPDSYGIVVKLTKNTSADFMDGA